MRDESPRPTNRELTLAFCAALWCALAAIAIAALVQQPSHGAAVTLAETTASTSQLASCRITNELPGGAVNIGSGTLVDVTSDGRSGLILTCAHLFTEGTGRIIATFPGGHSHGALLVAIDPSADLAALAISSPQAPPVGVNVSQGEAANLRACGYGSTGEFRCAAGRVVGTAARPGQLSVRIEGAVRSGDSGGGVFDESGRLAAVVWGETGGETYASAGPQLTKFLDGVLGRGRSPAAPTQGTLASCPNGMCPLVRPGISFRPAATAPVVLSPATAPPLNNAGCPCAEKLAQINQRLDAIERDKQKAAGYLTASDLGEYARREELGLVASESRRQHEELASRLKDLPTGGMSLGRAAGVLAATALGVSGPAGLAIVAGASAGGWFIGRRLKRRAQAKAQPPQSSKGGGAPSAPSRPEATAAAGDPFRDAEVSVEVAQPIERDDREARQLLRLSQLEGRDPLQDAVAGRIALDRLDAAADSDGDPQQAAWADAMRRELRERFNEIAPAKFEAPSQS